MTALDKRRRVCSGAHQRCSDLAKRRGGIGRLFRLFLAHCVQSFQHFTEVVLFEATSGGKQTPAAAEVKLPDVVCSVSS